MFDLYTAVCVQLDRRSVMYRKEIMQANLGRALEMIDWAHVRLDFPNFAPVKLILFPEVFLQGWCPNREGYTNVFEKIVKDIAIEIPGEETEFLSKKAREYKTFIAGTAHEVIPELTDKIALNCSFIIDPKGDVIYKFHKYNPYLGHGKGAQHISPHDMHDKYIKVMDGKFGRKKGDVLSCYFPVVDTEIGKLGHIICNDGYFFEHSRALAMQGCEVMLRSSGILEPEGCPPQQHWEITNRAPAFYNLMYVVACGPGDCFMPGRPKNATPGQTMIVDFQGAFLQHVTYTGETVTSAVINIDQLRRRRMDPRHNWIPQMRTEVYREIYKREMYPKNAYLHKLPLDGTERTDMMPIQKLIDEGVFVRPD